MKLIAPPAGEVAAVMAASDRRARPRAKGIRKNRLFSAGLRGAMSQGKPGNWASDHREESRHFTGWNYVAIHGLGIQATQATVTAYQTDADNAEQVKSILKMRRAKRQMYGTLASQRGKFASLYGEEEAEANTLSRDHRLMKLLRRPNPKQSGASFRYEQVMQLQLTGTCLIWNVPNQVGLTVERYVIPTAWATPERPSRQYPNGGWRIHPESGFVADADGFTQMLASMGIVNGIIPAEEIQVIRWPHPIYKDDGQSSLAASALWTDSAEMVDRARWSHLKDGPDPTLIVPIPADTNPSQEELDRYQAYFDKKYAGPNGRKAMFITARDGAGNPAMPVTVPPKAMAYVEAFPQFRDALLAIQQWPRGLVDGGSYAQLYAALKQASLLAVQPLLDLCAEEDTEQLSPQFGPGLMIESEAAAVDDPEILERMLATDGALGVRKRNEVRALRGLPPDPTEKGEEYVGAGAAAPPAAPAGPMGFSDSGEGNVTQSMQSGQYARGINRRDWVRNTRAINEIMGEFATGGLSEARVVGLLRLLDVPDETAREWIEDARDGRVEPMETVTNGNGSTNGHGQPKWHKRFTLETAVEKVATLAEARKVLEGVYP